MNTPTAVADNTGEIVFEVAWEVVNKGLSAHSRQCSSRPVSLFALCCVFPLSLSLCAHSGRNLHCHQDKGPRHGRTARRALLLLRYRSDVIANPLIPSALSPFPFDRLIVTTAAPFLSLALPLSFLFVAFSAPLLFLAFVVNSVKLRKIIKTSHCSLSLCFPP